jgi:hypothetical protein
MRRIAVYVALSFSVMLGLAAIAHGALAQESTPQAGIIPEPVHPLVGSWFVDNPGATPSVTSFTADGIMIDAEFDGGTGLGVWQPTGERTAAFSFVIPFVDDVHQFAVTIQIRGDLTVDASGNSGSGTYSVTVVQSDGTLLDTDEGTVNLTRMSVESIDAKGTPMAGVPTWNPSEGEGTPEATPAS